MGLKPISALRSATPQDADLIRDLVRAAFEDNVALYTRLGYRVDRREPFMGGTTIYMSKQLVR